MPLEIKNRDARRLWLTTNGLLAAPTGPMDLLSTIKSLGFVQLDTIQVVARAHHHILWSRNQNYREAMFDDLYTDRHVFEHFTHDASVIPMEFLPMWKCQFNNKKQQIDGANWYKSMPDAKGRALIVDRIRSEGALSTKAFDTKVKGEKQMWARPPHKLALDYMWYSGELATCYRQNFNKFYNLSERVFPADLDAIIHDRQTQIDWLCENALLRLGVASLAEIKNFWDVATTKEVKDWANRTTPMAVRIQGRDGAYSDALATADIDQRIETLKSPNSRIRIINPFDPATRDRDRLVRLFGFEYKIEMFVPAAKRKWGYYVYPILQGDTFIGRIEVKAERPKDKMIVKNLWHEAGRNWTAAQQDKLDAEITRLARFAGVSELEWQCQKPH